MTRPHTSTARSVQKSVWAVVSAHSGVMQISSGMIDESWPAHRGAHAPE
jgi:hypothetical protein